MAKIKIYGDVVKGCIFFDGSTVEPKFLGTVLAEVKADETDRIVIYRTDRQDSLGNNRQLFKRLQPTRIQNEEAVDLIDNLGYSIQDVVDYINGQSNLTASVNPVIDTSLNGEELGFNLDATSTSIIFDNGYQYGVNTIKAIDTGDGLITIKSIEDARVHFTQLDHTMVDINGVDAVGGLNDVINALNELFTVGAFEQIVISDPYSTMIADVDGVDAGYTLEGADAVDPIGDDIFSYDGVGYANYAGLKSVATIDQAGEYYTFDIRGEGTIGFGLVHTQASYDAGLYSGNASYADPASFAAINSAHYGVQFSHWFHATPNGSWTNYGANTGYSMRAGWSNFNGTDEQADWLAGNPIKVRVGIDNNSYISIETLRDGSSWEVHARSSYPVIQGSSYHLGVKSQSAAARVFSAPKVHLLEPAAPTMYFRYIESPDGNFEYPLFATNEEAKYYHEVMAGVAEGVTHTHTYNDDPTNTTWYMPDNGQMTGVNAPYNMVFDGQTVLFTEITSLTNSSFVPSQFSANDITQEEGTNVNIQVTPQGASWSTSVTITPSGSGLVYDGYSVLQGTLTDVGVDTTYTISVTRANSYGSTTGTMTVTATDVAPVQTNDTSWTKAIDFSGSSEFMRHTHPYATASQNPLGISNGTYIAKNANPLYTASSSSSRPFATAIVFKADGNNSLQTIWNNGEGFSSSGDNFGLEIDANNTLWFYYGQGATTSASSYNKCYVQIGIDTSKWYGVYIAHKGGRLSSADATKANLGECFDIRVMSSADGFTTISPNRSATNSGGNWQGFGRRMDKTVNGYYSVGATASTQKPFYGKVASSVITTLKNNSLAPVEAEIKMMITDPIKWQNDYKQGSTFRLCDSSSTASVPSTISTTYMVATQIHLMGDSVGIYPYSNNDAYPDIFNNLRWASYTKLVMQNMVSNDIETVNINGLT